LVIDHDEDIDADGLFTNQEVLVGVRGYWRWFAHNYSLPGFDS